MEGKDEGVHGRDGGECMRSKDEGDESMRRKRVVGVFIF